MSSTRSRESAFRSSTNEASGLTSSSSTPSCSTTIFLSRSYVEATSHSLQSRHGATLSHLRGSLPDRTPPRLRRPGRGPRSGAAGLARRCRCGPSRPTPRPRPGPASRGSVAPRRARNARANGRSGRARRRGRRVRSARSCSSMESRLATTARTMLEASSTAAGGASVSWIWRASAARRRALPEVGLEDGDEGQAPALTLCVSTARRPRPTGPLSHRRRRRGR